MITPSFATDCAACSPATATFAWSARSATAAPRCAKPRGYVAKEAAAAEVVAAVREVAAGRRYVSPALAEQLPDPGRPAQRSGEGMEQLTLVELEILRLVAEGQSNPQVAAIFNLSPRTVETYRLRLMRKLDLENLPALVKYAIRQGITQLE